VRAWRIWADFSEDSVVEEPAKKHCGLIMPISAIDGCPAEHWLDVKEIITQAVDSVADYDFKVKLVSDCDELTRTGRIVFLREI
jgi:hypothetical protein